MSLIFWSACSFSLGKCIYVEMYIFFLFNTILFDFLNFLYFTSNNIEKGIWNEKLLKQYLIDREISLIGHLLNIWNWTLILFRIKIPLILFKLNFCLYFFSFPLFLSVLTDFEDLQTKHYYFLQRRLQKESLIQINFDWLRWLSMIFKGIDVIINNPKFL